MCRVKPARQTDVRGMFHVLGEKDEVNSGEDEREGRQDQNDEEKQQKSETEPLKTTECSMRPETIYVFAYFEL